MAAQVRSLLNHSRHELGLQLLSSTSALDVVAFQHASEMARRQKVTHHSYLFGVSTSSRVKLAFPRLLQFGENVAMNRGPSEVHEALLSSPGHRLNRLDPSFTHVGIGVARADARRIFVTEVFVRAPNTEIIRSIAVLYTEAAPASLPTDEAVHGEITGEVISIPPPGPDDPEHWTHLGIDAHLAGRYDEAIRHFRRALQLDPGYDYARFDLGRSLIAAGQPAEAIVALTEYIAEFPDDTDARHSIGSAELLTQDYAGAEASFRRVLQKRRRDASAWYNLGLALELQGLPRPAENAYVQALAINAKLTPAAAGLARVRR